VFANKRLSYTESDLEQGLISLFLSCPSRLFT
jgi:hypothetical protein